MNLLYADSEPLVNFPPSAIGLIFEKPDLPNFLGGDNRRANGVDPRAGEKLEIRGILDLVIFLRSQIAELLYSSFTSSF